MARSAAGQARHSRQLMRRRAHSFYFASLFLPRSVRPDVRLAYAFYRAVDDLADDPNADRLEAFDRLARWEDELCGRRPASSPLLSEARRLQEHYSIPLDVMCMIFDGARFDLADREIATLQDLRAYSVQVAGSAGMVMAHILGDGEPEALEAACELGIAMQITNVVRDVGEDLRRGRIYLPRAYIARSGWDPEAGVTPAFREIMGDLIAEARRSYGLGLQGIHYLQPSTRFGILLAASLYSRILDLIEVHDYDVFSRRIHTSPVEKWSIVIQLSSSVHDAVMLGR